MVKKSKITAIILAVLLILLNQSTVFAAIKPSVGTGYKYILELEGKYMGYIKSFSGGMPYSEVFISGSKSNSALDKTTREVLYDDIKICATSIMDADFYDWIGEFMANTKSEKTGAVIVLDYNRKIVKRIIFNNALIKEVIFPSADASTNKTPVYTNITISPETTEIQVNPGTIYSNNSMTSGMNQKQLMTADFTFTIKGISGLKVSKISEIIISKENDSAAETAESGIQPMDTVNIESLVLQVPENQIDSLMTWYLRNLGNGESAETSAALRFFTINFQKSVLNFELNGVGLYKMTYNPPANSGLGYYTVEIYVEDADFSYTP